MMSLGNTVPQTPGSENGVSGNRRIPCPLHGCKRVYTDTGALESHVKEHEIPAQSLPGKLLLCSTAGCSGSFANMQKLMEHVRHHHKPNIYFQCESCRTKLRTYRNLLGHLHTCSKVPRGKTKAAELTSPLSSAVSGTNISTKTVEQVPPQLESMSSAQLAPFQVANPDGAPPAAVHQRGSADPPVLGPPILPLPEISSPQLVPLQLSETAPQSQLRNEASNQSASPKAAPDPSDNQTQLQTHSRSSEAILHASGTVSSSPPGSSAVWKKNQGMASSRRVLWEHTRGRYTCVQCGHVVTNRKEMTLHISSKHAGNKAADDTEDPATSP